MPADRSGHSADVVVVGAGPTGLMTAGELARRGVRVVVLEQRAGPLTETRASTIHPRTMELFAERGLLAAFGDVPNRPAGHFGGLPLGLDDLETPFPGLWSIPQPELERVLGEWAAGLGAALHRGVLVSGVEPGDGVVSVVTPGAVYEAGFVVGCDGENSLVAAAAGIGFTGPTADRDLLAADVTGIDVRARRFERTATGLAVAAPRPDGVTRVMVHRFGAGRSAWPGVPDFELIAREWAAVTGEDISGGRAIWRHAFGNQSRLADRYRTGSLLIAGDAAHRALPSGGQSLNLGLRDAVALGPKLAAEVRGTAAPGLLDSYGTGQRAVAEKVLANVRAQGDLLMTREAGPARAVLSELLTHRRARIRLAEAITGLDSPDRPKSSTNSREVPT